ncbi:hypothetical protein GH741_03760 [Aquibacillus halophilus]|uniref:Peptidoglycan binding domain-containing protein n=1 Tax=Aquibacillus halophilus TaxID=930132 RepID=A0A6A8DFZ5_9BACI|nr:VanW family protein [Aquibacillus halophilus]MRH41787.1 hypothetical protein [Aquibacillus halophilus]
MKSIALSLLLLTTIQPVLEMNLLISHRGIKIDEVSRSEFAIPLLDETIIDQAKYHELVEKLEKVAVLDPINAFMDEKGEIVPGESGYALDRYLFAQQFYDFFYKNSYSKIQLPLRKVYPKVDGELLDSIRSKQIGKYVTYFNVSNKERSHNIRLATEAINNEVVFPDETFSFNQVVGKRTEGKGYLPAPVIVKGELAEDIGGGICQVSSTLYNAVDQAGMRIGQRYSHSRHVPYVPPGRDATVSWYGPDFSFENNYNQPILIRAKTVHGKVIISIYSSDQIRNEEKSIPNASKQLPFEINRESKRGED